MATVITTETGTARVTAGEAPKLNGLHNIISAYDDDSESDENCEDEENLDNRHISTSKKPRLEPESEPEAQAIRVASTIKPQKTENASNSTVSGQLSIKKDVEAALPLPAIFATAVNSKNNEVEILPDGRVRSFPHERGNWASFVYIPFDQAEGIAVLHETLTKRIKELNFTQRVIHICDDFHLSLTKTLVFRHHWIDPFIQSIKKKLLQHKSFDVTFGEFRAFVNDDKTRSFLSLEVFPANGLLELVHDCDECLVDYELEKYYENPSFHISMGWMVGNQEFWMNHNIVPYMNHEWSELCDNDPTLRSTTVSSIVFKTGNKGYEFAF